MRKKSYAVLLLMLILAVSENALAARQCQEIDNGLDPCRASYIIVEGMESEKLADYCEGNAVHEYYCDNRFSAGYSWSTVTCGGAGSTEEISVTRPDSTTEKACQCKANSDYCMNHKPDCSAITSCDNYTSLGKNACNFNDCKDTIGKDCHWDDSTSKCLEGKDPCASITSCADYGIDQCTSNACKAKINSDCELSGSACKTKAGTTGEKKSVFDRIKDGIYQILMTLYCIVLYIAATVAALFIILTGIQYMSSDEESGRAASRKRLEYALIGLMVVALACPIVNVLFSGTDIGIEDANGNKVPCPRCPLIPGGGTEPTPTPTPSPTPSPAPSPTPTSTPTPSPTGKTCAELGGICCVNGEVGSSRGKRFDEASDCKLLCFEICEKEVGVGVRYGSCAVACRDAKDAGGTGLGYTAGECKDSCNTVGGEFSVNTFDCQGKTCCCTKPVKTGKEGSYCDHTSDCTDPGLYCSGGANNPFDKNKCLRQKDDAGKCPPLEEIDGKGINRVCKKGIVCWTRAGSDNPYGCLNPTCGSFVWPGGKCCKAGETCVGKKTGTAEVPITDCPDNCCSNCEPTAT